MKRDKKRRLNIEDFIEHRDLADRNEKGGCKIYFIIIFSEYTSEMWINELMNTLTQLYDANPVVFVIVGVVVIILCFILLFLVVYGIVYVCMKYSCCEVTYNVNSPQTIKSLNMRKLPESMPMPPPPPPTPATTPKIDVEKKKMEEQHPSVQRIERATRQKVMFLDECGNIPVYTLRSRSVDGTSGGFTTVMNVDVKPKPKMYQETEV